MVETIIALLQYLHVCDNGHEVFHVTGTFSNPSQLGCLLAVSAIMLSGLLMQQAKGWRRMIAIIVLCLQITVLIVTGSRAAILSLIVGCIPVLSDRYRFKIPYLPLLLALLLLVSGLYSIRPSSANGRLLIWRISAEMFLDKPLFGFGFYGFQKNYLLYQAEFLKTRMDSSWANIADNVAFPYNEYIHILIDFGLVGLLTFVFILWTALKNSKSEESVGNIFKYALLTFSVFAFFSYPLYTFRLNLLFWMICICPLLSSRKMKPENVLSCFIIIISIGMNTYCAFQERIFENRIKSLSSQSDTERADAKLYLNANYEEMKRYPFVFDLYMQELVQNQEADSLKIFGALNICPSTHLYCNAGDFCLENGNIAEAEHSYMTAYWMAPKYLTAKYKLFLLYFRTNDYCKARKIGSEILSASYKIRNTQTLRMLADVQSKLKDLPHPDLSRMW